MQNKVAGKHLGLADQLLREIASIKALDDSFYIVDLPLLARDLSTLRKAADNIRLCVAYSYKTNYQRSIVSFLDTQNVLSEVVSPFEVDLSKQYSINSSKIIYNGPLKSRDSILYTLTGGGLVNADSLDDLHMIVNIISNSSLDPCLCRVGLRACLDNTDLPFSRFGLSVVNGSFQHALSMLDAHSIPLSCLHVHYPQRDLNSFKARVSAALELLVSLKSNRYLSPAFVLNLGGGLPSPNLTDFVSRQLGLPSGYDAIDKYFDFLYQKLASLGLLDVAICVEPGTFLAANCIHLVGSIRTINTRSNLTIASSDLSLNLLGGLKSKIVPLTFLISSSKTILCQPDTLADTLLTGYTCVESDVICSFEDVSPKVHDKVIIPFIGSYSIVFKPPFIRGDIQYYEWNGNHLRLIRNQQSAEHITGLDLT